MSVTGKDTKGITRCDERFGRRHDLVRLKSGLVFDVIQHDLPPTGSEFLKGARAFVDQQKHVSRKIVFPEMEPAGSSGTH